MSINKQLKHLQYLNSSNKSKAVKNHMPEQQAKNQCNQNAWGNQKVLNGLTSNHTLSAGIRKSKASDEQTDSTSEESPSGDEGQNLLSSQSPLTGGKGILLLKGLRNWSSKDFCPVAHIPQLQFQLSSLNFHISQLIISKPRRLL